VFLVYGRFRLGVIVMLVCYFMVFVHCIVGFYFVVVLFPHLQNTKAGAVRCSSFFFFMVGGLEVN